MIRVSDIPSYVPQGVQVQIVVASRRLEPPAIIIRTWKQDSQ